MAAVEEPTIAQAPEAPHHATQGLVSRGVDNTASSQQFTTSTEMQATAEGRTDVFVVSACDARLLAGHYRCELGHKYRSVRQFSEVCTWVLEQDAHRIWSFAVSPQQSQSKSVKARALHAARLPEEVLQWEIQRVCGNYFSKVQADFGGSDRDPVWVTTPDFRVSSSMPLCECCTEFATKDGWTRCMDHALERSIPLSVQRCPRYLEALDFMQNICPELDISRWPATDMCYCHDCYPLSASDHITECFSNVNLQVAVPRGFVAFSLALPKDEMRGDNGMWRWPVTFHGTTPQRLLSILRAGHIGMPGDLQPDGSLLQAKNSAESQHLWMVTSKTLNYSGLQLYATPQPWDFGETAGQVVLQCRQDLGPGQILKIGEETMGFQEEGFPARGIDPSFDIYDRTAGIEIFSNKPDRCVPYRVLVRTFNRDEPPDKTRHPQGLETFRSPRDPAANTFRKDGSRFY